MTTTVLFLSAIQSMQFLTATAKPLTFRQGKFSTDNEEDIEALRAEIKKGNPYIREASEKETAAAAVPTTADPIAALREKLRAELLTEMNVDTAGTTADAKVSTRLKGIVSSKQIADGAADSSSAS